MAIGLLLPTLTTCGATKPAEFAAQKRTLPKLPEFAKPVEVREPQPGESKVAYAARERAGRGVANRIIIRLRDWYSGVVRDYEMPVQ